MTHQEFCTTFWQTRRSVILSTQSETGVSETSVTPFVVDEAGHLYVFISELAQHTQNILAWMDKHRGTSSDDLPAAALMSALVVADESETEQLFARERLTLQLAACEITPEQAEYESLLQRFEAEHGDVVSMLKSLPDFHLIQLTSVRGGYVRGFGQAFTFEGCPCQNLTPISRK